MSELGSISPSFYEQLFRQQIYTELTGIWHKVHSVKVGRNFKLCVLGAVLLVKQNSIFLRQTMCANAFALCASGLVKLTPGRIEEGPTKRKVDSIFWWSAKVLFSTVLSSQSKFKIVFDFAISSEIPNFYKYFIKFVSFSFFYRTDFHIIAIGYKNLYYFAF